MMSHFTLYLIGNRQNPRPGNISPPPIESIIVTPITNPYSPVHDPSTSLQTKHQLGRLSSATVCSGQNYL